MSTPVLSLTTGFATGAVVTVLQVVGDAVIVREAVDNSDSLQCRIAIPLGVTVGVRMPVRLLGADGIEREYRITSYIEDPGLRWADIVCAAPIEDLALAGTVRTDQNGETVTSFGGELTVSQWLTNYVLTNLTADGLTWLSSTPGTIDVNSTIALQWARFNRTQVLQALIAKLDGAPEFYLTQSGPGAQYQLCVGHRNGALTPLVISPDLNVIRKARAHTDELIMTAVEPYGAVPEGGDEPANINEHAWSPSLLGGGWVQLLPPNDGPPAVALPDQFKYGGYYLEVPNGSGFDYRAIDDADLADSSVHLADDSLLSDPLILVRVVRDNTGLPISELPDPEGAALYGRVTKPFEVPDGRGERNWMVNAFGNAGDVNWNWGTNAYIEPIPKNETTDLVALANGAKPTGGAASIAVDGVPPGTVFRRGTTFTPTSNETLFVATTTTANGSGACTIPLVAANNLFNIPDNDPLTFYRNTYGWPSNAGPQMLRFQGVNPSALNFTSDAFIVGIRGGVARTVWARFEGVLWAPIATTGIGTSPIPVTFSVLNASNTVIATLTDNVPVPVQSDPRPAPSVFSMAIQLELSATAQYKLRISCAATSTAAPFFGLYINGCSVVVSSDPNVPLINGSHANALWQKANRVLANAHVTSPNVTATLMDLSQISGAQLVRDGLKIGQSVSIRDLGVVQRAVAITRNHLNDRVVDVQCAQLAMTLSDRLVA